MDAERSLGNGSNMLALWQFTSVEDIYEPLIASSSSRRETNSEHLEASYLSLRTDLQVSP
jgi:hypothetical protein